MDCERVKIILSAVLSGMMVALSMRYVPIFHGYDSQDIKRIIFVEPKTLKKYTLIPEKINCN